MALAWAYPAIAAKKIPPKRAYGAIAYHHASLSFGYGYDFPTSREARIEALRQCGHQQCQVVVAFQNACAALASGPKNGFPATGATRQEAETKAMKRCASPSCKPLVWACTK